MAEYIDKNDLREYISGYIKSCDGVPIYTDIDALIGIISLLEQMPAADVQPVDRWIDAQTNPPIATDGETSDYVLVLRADGRQCVCYYVYDDDEGNYWCSEDEKSIYGTDEVTRWQPLPKTPQD